MTGELRGNGEFWAAVVRGDLDIDDGQVTDCPHMTGAASCTVCQQVAAVEGLLALAARVSPSPNMTVEVRHVRYALDKRRVPDLLAGKKAGQPAVGPAA